VKSSSGSARDSVTKHDADSRRHSLSSAHPSGEQAHRGKSGEISGRETLAVMASVVPDLARALGPDHEVVVHDLALIPNSIIAIGGSITGRPVGGPITDLLLRDIRQGQTDSIFRYQTHTTDSRTLTSSTVFIRDPDGSPIGCLCINRDVTELLGMDAMCRRVMGAIEPTNMSPSAGPAAETAQINRSRVDETFAPTVEDMALSLVNQAIDGAGVPVDLMQKRHKLQVIQELEAAGLFLLRDAVDLTASMLHISRESVYNYLKESRNESQQGAEKSRRRRVNRQRLNLDASESPTQEG
jgi:predicted transcriptional regulator YheO